MTSKQLLLQYLVNNHIRLENDVQQLRNNLVLYPSAVDCLELLIALSKLEQFGEMFHDIMQIYKLAPEDFEPYIEKSIEEEPPRKAPRWLYYR